MLPKYFDRLRERALSQDCVVVEPKGREPLAGKEIVKKRYILQGRATA
jgi:hypothetical protein